MNKENKKKHKYYHCVGTKSFAEIREEEVKPTNLNGLHILNVIFSTFNWQI